MFKKICTLAALLCVIPVMANAATKWQLGTRAMSQGGVIDSRNKTGQTVANGSIFRQYTTATNSTVTVQPNAGFKISKISNNGIITVAPITAPYTFAPDGTGNVTIQATFARVSFALNAITGANGSVSKSSYPIVYVGTQSPAKTFIFTPNPGFAVQSITPTAGVLGTNFQYVNALTGAPVTLPAATGVKVKINVVNVPSNITFSVSFTGTAPVVIIPPNTTIAQLGRAQCADCHATQGVGAGVFTRWSSSAHKNNSVLCYGCHVGANFGGHPGVIKSCASCHSSVTGHSTAASACSNCHDSHGATSTHPTAVSRPDCATCHGTVAAPHYGGTAFIEAQYVSDASLPVSCTNCHGDPVTATANQAILAQYTSSAHGSPLAEAWRHYDWRSSTRASCQRCHAGTAFVAKLGNENNTTNTYQPTDILKPGEVLNCSACHTNPGTGALRTAAQQFTINMTNAAVTYEVTGASTLCARCHGGRESGDSIKADTDADGVRGFIDSHYLGAAGTVYNKGGYEYAGQDYDTLGSHKNVGTGVSGTGSQGPCVACHMGLGTANHTWKVANSNACVNCHSNPTAAKLAEAKASYEAALEGLRLALEAKGIYFDPAHPYFFTAAFDPEGVNTPFTNWAGVYGVSSWKDVMGAAFNYNLLVNDPGAYAHNKQYALKLIADSCDFLADSAVDGQGIPAAVTTAINSVAFGLK